MIVCICNRITDAQVREAIGKGARTRAEVFKILRQQRSCGQCSEQIDSILDQELAAEED